MYKIMVLLPNEAMFVFLQKVVFLDSQLLYIDNVPITCNLDEHVLHQFLCKDNKINFKKYFVNVNTF